MYLQVLPKILGKDTHYQATRNPKSYQKIRSTKIFHVPSNRKSDKNLIIPGCINSVFNEKKFLVSYVSLVTQAPWQDFLAYKNSLIGVDDEASVATPLDPVQLSTERHDCFQKWTMEKIFLTEYKRPTSSGAKSIPEIPEEYQGHHGRVYYSLQAGCSAANGKHWNKLTKLIHRNSLLLGHPVVH